MIQFPFHWAAGFSVNVKAPPVASHLKLLLTRSWVAAAVRLLTPDSPTLEKVSMGLFLLGFCGWWLRVEESGVRSREEPVRPSLVAQEHEPGPHHRDRDGPAVERV